MVFKALEPEHAHIFIKPCFLFCLILYMPHAAQYVLPHCHVRKQSIVLEHVSHAALLRRKIYALFAVEQNGSVKLDAPFIRLFYAGYAFERHALAAAGRAEEARHAVFRFKFRLKLE